MTGRYTVVYEGDPRGVKILSGEPATGRAITVTLGDMWEEARTFHAERDQLAAEIAALRVSGDGGGSKGWLPISSAPTDGSEVLCLAPEYAGPVMLKFYKHNGLAAWRDWDQDTYRPTHWLPIPALSSPTKIEGADKR